MYTQTIIASLILAVATALPAVEQYDKDNCNNGAIVIGNYPLKAQSACQEIPNGSNTFGAKIQGSPGSLPAGCSFRFYANDGCASNPANVNFWPLTSEGQYNSCFAPVQGQPIRSVQAFGTCAVYVE